LRVWAFPVCAAVAILLAVFAGVATVVMVPVLIWTGILYVRCTREAIRSRHHGED
jgi:hypothetical protein